MSDTEKNTKAMAPTQTEIAIARETISTKKAERIFYRVASIFLAATLSAMVYGALNDSYTSLIDEDTGCKYMSTNNGVTPLLDEWGMPQGCHKLHEQISESH